MKIKISVIFSSHCAGSREEGLRDYLQISLLSLREFKQINRLIFPLESSENRRFAC